MVFLVSLIWESYQRRAGKKREKDELENRERSQSGSAPGAELIDVQRRDIQYSM
jgi:hypothetical protein